MGGALNGRYGRANQTRDVICTGCGAELSGDAKLYEYNGHLYCECCFADDMDCDIDSVGEVAEDEGIDVQTAEDYLDNLDACHADWEYDVRREEALL